MGVVQVDLRMSLAKQDNKWPRPQSDPDSSIEDPFCTEPDKGIVISKVELITIIQDSINKTVSISVGEKIILEFDKIKPFYENKIERISERFESRIFELESRLEKAEKSINANSEKQYYIRIVIEKNASTSFFKKILNICITYVK